MSALSLKPASHRHKKEPSLLMHRPWRHTLSLLHSSTSVRILKQIGEKKEKPVMRDNWRIRGVKIYYKLINAKHPHLSCAFIRSAGNNPPFFQKKKKESAIKCLSEHKMHRAFRALNRTLANRKTKWNIKKTHLPQLSGLRTFTTTTLKKTQKNATHLISCALLGNCSITT